MDIDSVLGRAPARVAEVTTHAATSTADLIEQSAVEATGSATRTVERSAKSPALATALLALAAIGGVVGMRVIFRGAIS